MKDQRRLLRSLLCGEIYLGPALAAMQGPPERHRYFYPTAATVAERFPGSIRILEIGSWAGASTISWARSFLALRSDVQVECVDQWLPYFDLSLETNLHYRQMNIAAENQEIYSLFLHNLKSAGINSIVQVHRGSSRDVLPALKSESFHLIYIDGSHAYEDVLTDIHEAKRLIVNGGVICGDDLEVQAGELAPSTLRQAVLSGRDYVNLEDDERHFHPGVTSAVNECFGPVSSWEGYWAVRWEDGRADSVQIDNSKLHMPKHIQDAIEKSCSPTVFQRTSGYTIFQRADDLIAISDLLFEKHAILLEESQISVDIPPAIYVAQTIGDLLLKVPATQACKAGFSESTQNVSEPTLLGCIENYNIVSYAGSIYGIHISSGSIDVRDGIRAILDKVGPCGLVLAPDVERARAAIALRQNVFPEMCGVQGTTNTSANHSTQVPISGESLFTLLRSLDVLAERVDASQTSLSAKVGQVIDQIPLQLVKLQNLESKIAGVQREMLNLESRVAVSEVEQGALRRAYAETHDFLISEQASLRSAIAGSKELANITADALAAKISGCAMRLDEIAGNPMIKLFVRSNQKGSR